MASTSPTGLNESVGATEQTAIPRTNSANVANPNRLSVVAANKAFFEQRAQQLAEQEALLTLHAKHLKTWKTSDKKSGFPPVTSGEHFVTSSRILDGPLEKPKTLIDRYTEQNIGIATPQNNAASGGAKSSLSRQNSYGAELSTLSKSNSSSQLDATRRDSKTRPLTKSDSKHHLAALLKNDSKSRLDLQNKNESQPHLDAPDKSDSQPQLDAPSDEQSEKQPLTTTLVAQSGDTMLDRKKSVTTEAVSPPATLLLSTLAVKATEEQKAPSLDDVTSDLGFSFSDEVRGHLKAIHSLNAAPSNGSTYSSEKQAPPSKEVDAPFEHQTSNVAMTSEALYTAQSESGPVQMEEASQPPLDVQPDEVEGQKEVIGEVEEAELPTWRSSDEAIAEHSTTDEASVPPAEDTFVFPGDAQKFGNTLRRMPRRQEKTEGAEDKHHAESHRHSSPFPSSLYGSEQLLGQADGNNTIRSVLSGSLNMSSNTLKRRTVHFPATLLAQQRFMVVTTNYTATIEGHLSVAAGEMLLVTNPDPALNVWLAKRQGEEKEGLIPKEIVRESMTVFGEVLQATDEQVEEASPGAADSKEDLSLLEPAVNPSSRVSVRNSIISTITTRRAPQTENDSWWSQVGSKLPRDEMMSITRAYRQRQETIYELVTTQRSFVQDMEMTWTWFVQPLRECVNEMTWRQLFSNLDKVIDTHRLLSTALIARADSCGWNFDLIGDILVDKLPHFKLSAIFCSHFALSLELLAALKVKPEVSKVYEEFSQQPYFNSLNPESYLLAPMQRVSKFNILIRAIIGTTEKEHPDYAILQQANSVAANVLFYINTECGKAQEWQKLQKLQVKLSTELQDEIGAETLDPLERELQDVTEMGYGGESKRISVYTFSDTVLMLTTKSNMKGGERLTLYRQPLNLNLTEFARADQWDARAVSHRFTRKAKKSGSRKESDLITSKMILVYENVTDNMHELYCSSSKERDDWLARIKTLQKDVIQSSLFRLDKLVAGKLPSELYSQEWTSAASLDQYYLLAANETVYAVSRKGQMNDIRELITFKKKRVQQMEVHRALNLLITIQGKQQSVVTYDLDAVKTGIEATFANKGVEIVGNKLPGSKNVRFFRINDDDLNSPTLIAASGRHFSTYTFSRVTKVYKKSGDFEISVGDAQDCTDITFIKSKAVIALGSEFYLADQKSGTFNVMPKPYLPDAYYGNMQAITCIQLAAKRFLMCYDNAAFITDHAAAPLYDWAFEWQAPLVKCEVHDDYILAFTRHFVEVWELKTGVLQQVLLTPELRLLSHKEEGIRVTLESSAEGLPILGKIIKNQVQLNI